MKPLALAVLITVAACAAEPAGQSPAATAEDASGTTLEENTSAPTTSDSSDGATTTPTSGPGLASTTTSGLQPRPTTTRVPQADLTGVPEWFSDQGPLPAHLASAIKAKLASDAGVGVDQVVEEGAMFVTWRNSALGCQAPGEMSMQVLTDGYLAYFNIAGDRYRVHTDLDSAFRICNLAAPPDPLPTM